MLRSLFSSKTRARWLMLLVFGPLLVGFLLMITIPACMAP